MKNNEAADVFSLVCAMYDLHPERASELAKVWVPALARRDAVATMDILGRWAEGRSMPDRMPPVGLFIAIVKAEEQKLAAPAEPCPTCIDGWVQVGVHVYMQAGVSYEGADIVAPCPRCDVGKLIEFPLDADGLWGEQGWWRGREWERVRQGVVEVEA